MSLGRTTPPSACRIAALAASRHGSHLTPREREVAALVAEGLTNQEIATRLVLTSGTVANHVSSIQKRLGARNRVQVAVWAVERGLRARETEPR